MDRGRKALAAAAGQAARPPLPAVLTIADDDEDDLVLGDFRRVPAAAAASSGGRTGQAGGVLPPKAAHAPSSSTARGIVLEEDQEESLQLSPLLPRQHCSARPAAGGGAGSAASILTATAAVRGTASTTAQHPSDMSASARSIRSSQDTAGRAAPHHVIAIEEDEEEEQHISIADARRGRALVSVGASSSTGSSFSLSSSSSSSLTVSHAGSFGSKAGRQEVDSSKQEVDEGTGFPILRSRVIMTVGELDAYPSAKTFFFQHFSKLLQRGGTQHAARGAAYGPGTTERGLFAGEEGAAAATAASSSSSSAAAATAETCESSSSSSSSPSAAAAAAVSASSSSSSDFQEHDCVICHDAVSPADRGFLPVCEHVMHSECILQWVRFTNKCPLCKRSFTRLAEFEPLPPSASVSKWLQKGRAEVPAQAAAAGAGGSGMKIPHPSPPAAGSSSSALHSSSSSLPPSLSLASEGPVNSRASPEQERLLSSSSLSSSSPAAGTPSPGLSPSQQKVRLLRELQIPAKEQVFQPSEEDLRIAGYTAEELEAVCAICGDDEPEETLMLCDNHCGVASHSQCLGLREVPQGDWYCQRCCQRGQAAAGYAPPAYSTALRIAHAQVRAREASAASSRE